jgi:hypothetical protein
MAKASKQRKKEQEKEPKPKGSLLRKMLVAVLIAGAFAGTYYLGLRKRASRLDAFAQCLAAKQVKMYGLYWCMHCAEQKEIFGESFKYVPYEECGIKGSRSEAPSCIQEGVKNFPAWQFASERHEGVLSLQVLSEKSGCSLP